MQSVNNAAPYVSFNSEGLGTILRGQKIKNHQEVVKNASEMIDILNRQMSGKYGTIEEVNYELTFYGGVKKLMELIPGFENTKLYAWFEKISFGDYKLNISNHAPVYGPMPQEYVKVSVPITEEQLIQKQGVDMWQPMRKCVIDLGNGVVKKAIEVAKCVK